MARKLPVKLNIKAVKKHQASFKNLTEDRFWDFHDDIHKEFFIQLKGLLESIIGNHLYELEEYHHYEHWDYKNNLRLWISDTSSSFDIYVLDPHYAEYDRDLETVRFKEREECGFVGHERVKVGNEYRYYGDTQDWCMIGHFHSDDILLLLLEWENIKADMLAETDRIFREWQVLMFKDLMEKRNG